jgi:hypothetical protein
MMTVYATFEKVKRVRMDMRYGDITFYDERGLFLGKLDEVWEYGVHSLSFDEPKQVKLIHKPAFVREESIVEMELEFREPVTCRAKENHISCWKEE